MPHNLISRSKILFPLTKFLRLPRLKNLNVFWVQDRNPDILYVSLKKSWQAISFYVLQRGRYGDRYPITGHFYIPLDISLSLEGPTRKRPSMFPKSGAPILTDTHTRTLLNTSFGVHCKEPSLQVQLMESPLTEIPRSSSPHLFIIQSSSIKGPLLIPVSPRT